MAKPAAEGRFRDILQGARQARLTRGLNQKLRRVLEDLGPIRQFGQLLSMRPDMLPTGCEALTRLRTDVIPMDFETVRDMLESEYGQPPEKIFASIDSEPAGSASIAQAHRAMLKDGRPVILKVQRPGIYEKMAQDMRLLHRASSIFRIVRKTGQVIDFDNVIDEMWSAAQQELDFLIEAGHIREFTETTPASRTSLSRRWRRRSPRSVLVMEYVDGIQIDDTER